jgi:NADPH:quinone reductase-like Zn-dependent oxidoreductase
MGADIYATVASKQSHQLLMETFSIPESNILSSQHDSFSSAILEKTGGKGVDVVLNSLTGAAVQESFDCLGDFGRFIQLGKVDSACNSRLSKVTLRNNTALYSVDLAAWASRRPDVVSGALNQVVRLAHEKLVAIPESIMTYPISRIVEALSSLQTGQHGRKVVITVGDSDMVSVSLSQRDVMLPNWKKERKKI